MKFQATQQVFTQDLPGVPPSSLGAGDSYLVLSVLATCIHDLICNCNSLARWELLLPHVNDEGPEAQRGEVTCPRSHSQERLEPRLEPKSVWLQNLPFFYLQVVNFQDVPWSQAGAESSPALALLCPFSSGPSPSLPLSGFLSLLLPALLSAS